MPWCDGCDRYYNPNSVHDDGSCPTCGANLARPSALKRARAGRGTSADAQAVRADRVEETDPAPQDAETKAPWHFWLLLVALVIYLGYRLYEGVIWLSGRL